MELTTAIRSRSSAAATASGYMGSANAWGQGISGATNNLSQMAMLNQMMQPQYNLQQSQMALQNGQNPNSAQNSFMPNPTAMTQPGLLSQAQQQPYVG